MQEQIDLIQQVYELIVNFVVAYSFQLLGAVLVLIFGFVVGGWVSRALLRIQGPSPECRTRGVQSPARVAQSPDGI